MPGVPPVRRRHEPAKLLAVLVIRLEASRSHRRGCRRILLDSPDGITSAASAAAAPVVGVRIAREIGRLVRRRHLMVLPVVVMVVGHNSLVVMPNSRADGGDDAGLVPTQEMVRMRRGASRGGSGSRRVSRRMVRVMSRWEHAETVVE